MTNDPPMALVLLACLGLVARIGITAIGPGGVLATVSPTRRGRSAGGLETIDTPAHESFQSSGAQSARPRSILVYSGWRVVAIRARLCIVGIPTELGSSRTVSPRILDRAPPWLICASLVATFAVQVAKHDYFPPHDSITQYGVGPYGWLFTSALTLVALASLVLAVADRLTSPVPPRAVTVLMVVWAVCLVLVGTIHADPAGSAPTLGGRTHLVVAALALASLPIAALIRASLVRDRPRMVAVAVTILALLSALSLILLILAGYGVDITGLGRRRAWSLFETASVVLDFAIVYLLHRIAHAKNG